MDTIKSEEATDYRAESTEKETVQPFRVTCSRDAVLLLKTQLGSLRYGLPGQEHFIVLPLNVKNELQKQPVVTVIGKTNSVNVDIASIARCILRQPSACRYILMHNHPSNDTTPSPEDVSLTERAKRALDLFDFYLVDHIVVSSNLEKYSSMRDMGLLL